jgi:hypothetical protein
MNIRAAVFGIVAAAFFLWGPLFKPSLAMEPATAKNPTDPLPADANTPIHASNSVDDNRITQQIKGAIQADTTLSDSAKSVSIDTNQQAVILRGVVLNETDKDRVENLAGQYAGVRQVDSHLTVKDDESEAAGGHHIAIAPATRAH